MRGAVRVWGAAVVAGALAWGGVARVAGACPACAQAGEGDGAALWAVGAFMLVPFALAAVAVWALRGLAGGRAASAAARSGAAEVPPGGGG